MVDGTIDVYPEKKPVSTVAFEPERINRFLGIFVRRIEMKKILESLYFKVADGKVYVPSYRDDVRCMNDVAEEVVRIYGYNTIASSAIVAQMTQGGLTPVQQFREDLCSLLCGLGYDEICTYSFMSAKLYDKFGLPADAWQRKSVEIANPFGEDTKTMRTCALPSLLEALELNSTRGTDSAFLYEIAKVFIPQTGVVTNTHGLEGTLPDERLKVVLGFY